MRVWKVVEESQLVYRAGRATLDAVRMVRRLRRRCRALRLTALPRTRR